MHPKQFRFVAIVLLFVALLAMIGVLIWKVSQKRRVKTVKKQVVSPGVRKTKKTIKGTKVEPKEVKEAPKETPKTLEKRETKVPTLKKEQEAEKIQTVIKDKEKGAAEEEESTYDTVLQTDPLDESKASEKPTPVDTEDKEAEEEPERSGEKEEPKIDPIPKPVMGKIIISAPEPIQEPKDDKTTITDSTFEEHHLYEPVTEQEEELPPVIPDQDLQPEVKGFEVKDSELRESTKVDPMDSGVIPPGLPPPLIPEEKPLPKIEKPEKLPEPTDQIVKPIRRPPAPIDKRVRQPLVPKDKIVKPEEKAPTEPAIRPKRKFPGVPKAFRPKPKVVQEPEKPHKVAPKYYTQSDMDTIVATELPHFHPQYSFHPVGLRNLGLTCYLNASIQLLFTGTEVVKELLEKGERLSEGTIAWHLRQILVDLRDNKKPVDTSGLVDLLKQRHTGIGNTWDGCSDANEVLDLIISEINTSLGTQMFYMNQLGVVTCLECNKLMDTHEDGGNCVVCRVKVDDGDIPKMKEMLLEDLIIDNLMVNPIESLFQDVYCPKCKKKCNAKSVTSMRSYPNTIVCHLDRLISHSDVKKVYYSGMIHIPSLLALHGKVYRFVGSVDYHGYNLNQIGHYTATVRRGNVFYEINDMVVTDNVFENNVSTTATTVMYELVTDLPE